MIAIARSLIFEHGRSVRFIEFSRLLSQLREGYGKGVSDSPILNHLCSVPLLIIDELGKGSLTDWELSIIDEVVSRRYNANLPILGTTNYKWGAPTGAAAPNIAAREFEDQTLGDRVGGRVFSRLQETALYFECKGPEYRAMKPQNLSHGTSLPLRGDFSVFGGQLRLLLPAWACRLFDMDAQCAPCLGHLLHIALPRQVRVLTEGLENNRHRPFPTFHPPVCHCPAQNTFLHWVASPVKPGTRWSRK